MVTTVMTGWMQRPFVALGMLAIAMVMIPLNDALIKLMSAYMPLAEIALIRGVLSMIVLAVFTGGVGSMLALPACVLELLRARHVPCAGDDPVFRATWQPSPADR